MAPIENNTTNAPSVDISSVTQDTIIVDTIMDAANSQSSAFEMLLQLGDSKVAFSLQLVHAFLLALDPDFARASVLHAPLWMKPNSLDSTSSSSSSSSASHSAGNHQSKNQLLSSPQTNTEASSASSENTDNNNNDSAARMVILPLQLFYHNNMYVFHLNKDNNSILSLIVNLESAQHIKITVQALSSDSPTTKVIQHPLVSSRNSLSSSSSMPNGNSMNLEANTNSQNQLGSASGSNSQSNPQSNSNTDSQGTQHLFNPNLANLANQMNTMNQMNQMNTMNSMNSMNSVLGMLLNQQQQQQQQVAAARQQAAMLMAAQAQFNSMNSQNSLAQQLSAHSAINPMAAMGMDLGQTSVTQQSMQNAHASSSSSQRKQRKRTPRVCNKTTKLTLSTSNPQEPAAILISIGDNREMLMVASIHNLKLISDSHQHSKSHSSSKKKSVTKSKSGSTTTTTTTTSSSSISNSTSTTYLANLDDFDDSIKQHSTGIIMFANINTTQKLRLHFFSPAQQLPEDDEAQVPYVQAKLHEIDKLARCKVIVDFVEMANVRVKLSKDKPLVNLVVELRNQLNETVERVRQRLYFKSKGNFEQISKLSKLPTKINSTDTESPSMMMDVESNSHTPDEFSLDSSTHQSHAHKMDQLISSAMATVAKELQNSGSNKRKQPESVPNDDNDDSNDSNNSSIQDTKASNRPTRQSKRQRV